MTVYFSRSFIIEAREFASECDTKYYGVLKTHLEAFESTHERALQPASADSGIKQRRLELKQLVCEAKGVRQRADRLVQFVEQRESYAELPFLARIIGEVLRPMKIVDDLLVKHLWVLVAPVVLELIVTAQLLNWLPPIPDGARQTTLALLSQLTRASSCFRVVVAAWQTMYLPAYYHRLAIPNAGALDKLPDQLWLTTVYFLLLFVLRLDVEYVSRSIDS